MSRLFPSPGSPFIPPPMSAPNTNGTDPPDPPLSITPSLTSSRPAPPSPAVSRRTSGFSRTSSRPSSHSRPTSGALQPPISMTMTTPSPTTPRLPHDRPPSLPPNPDTTPSEPAPPPTLTTTAFIQIRDYGFAHTDPRFTGQGPNVPRANRPTALARRLNSALASGSIRTSSSEGDTVDDDDDDYEDEDASESRPQSMWPDADSVNGWHGFKWGLGRAWGLRPTSDGGFPSRGDLDRNFGGEDEEMDMDVDEPYSDEEGHVDAESEPLLCPGLYRAVYAFEPEGTAEMKLDEDQLVRVIGRGGGVGWAVVVKDGLKDTGVHALVPESYLEAVRLDGEDDDSEC